MASKRKPEEREEWLSFGWVFSYPLFAVLGVMVFLSAQELREPPPALVAKPARKVVDSPEWIANFPDRVEIVQAAMMVEPLGESLGVKVAEQHMQGSSALRWPHRVLEVRADREQRTAVEVALATLRGVDPGLNLVWEDTFNGAQVLVGVDGLLTHTVRVYWSDQPMRPRIGLVVASLGDDLRLARQVLEMEDPVTVAIRPFRPFSAQVAELASIFKREVLLDWNEQAAERHGLEAALGTVPGAVGVAVDDESLSTEQMAELQREGLFTVRPEVDTSATTRVIAIPHGDGWQRAVDAVMRQATEGGRAIAIADAAGSDQLSRLRALLGQWRQGEIEMVRVSRLLGGA